jgi:hypothetical protein
MAIARNNIPALMLVISALLLSRAIFFFIDDPEGPNLLVVAVTAVIVYASSMAIDRHIIARFFPRVASLPPLSLALVMVATQAAIAALLVLLMR